MSLSLGIDLGTSGVRSAVINAAGELISEARRSYGAAAAFREPEAWWSAVRGCLSDQMQSLRETGRSSTDIAAIAVDGTSGSLVLVDRALSAVTPALMYSDGGLSGEAEQIAAQAPHLHITRGSNSSLARLLHLQSLPGAKEAAGVLHQADFVLARLRREGGVSDENNALKLGFDPETKAWPAWYSRLPLKTELLPRIVPAGTQLGPIDQDVASEFGLSPSTWLHAGTTDSLAAFLAAAPLETGSAVTSLGTTLAIKVVSETRIDAPEMGLYSHRLGGRWLVGGASNTGGGALLTQFSADEIRRLSARINAKEASPLDYYPLARAGERFPQNDPTFAPRMGPRPESDVAHLHGLLEGIARIEASCYDLIQELGGPRADVILTTGGGAHNRAWTEIRSRVLGRSLGEGAAHEAAVGAARLTQLPQHTGA
ncbi:MAG: FGGY-family carbohydrate kinase [Pseudomonadota bacterium]